MLSSPPLGIVLGTLSVERGFSCPGAGCWLALAGMLFVGSTAVVVSIL